MSRTLIIEIDYYDDIDADTAVAIVDSLTIAPGAGVVAVRARTAGSEEWQAEQQAQDPTL